MRLNFSGNRFFLRRKDEQKKSFCVITKLPNGKSPRFKGSVINTGSLFPSSDNKKNSLKRNVRDR